MTEFFVTGKLFAVEDDIDGGEPMPVLFLGEYAVGRAELRHALVNEETNQLEGTLIPDVQVYELVPRGDVAAFLGVDYAE